MELQKLHPDVLSKIRSSFTVNTVTQCVIELVLNSLDAKSTAIAIRINLVTFRIQVVDNGEGIPEESMNQVGRRYFTNKCSSLEQLEKHIKHYGFRGEALASIIESSKSVNITSRHVNSSKTHSKTWGKHISNGVSQVRDRPSVGTTVTVEGFFHNLPIRRKRIISELELEDIKRSMESLMIMNPNVSFTIRNDITGELVLNTKKNKDIISSFSYLHPEVGENFCFMKISKGKLSIDALLYRELSENKRLQYLFVNKRPICSPKIQKLVCGLYYKFHKVKKKKSTDFNKHPVYVMNIKCPYSQLDILLNPTKTMVEFENWDLVQRCIEKLINSFFGSEDKSQKCDKPVIPVEDIKKDGGISEMGGAFRSYGFKRKHLEDRIKTPEKLTILEDEDIIEETQLPKGKPSDNPFEESFCFNRKQRKKNGDHAVLLEEGKTKSFSTRNVSQRKKVDEVAADSEIHHISDTSSFSDRRVKHNIKKPLPVQVLRKENKADKNIKVNNLAEQDDAKSTLSKFTDDQNKGKSLIMNMFLKSTQIYSSDENVGEISASQETIYEEESNFLMENNIQTKVNGVSKAMSVSVNVKSTKKIRKAKKTEQKASKFVQTSLKENRMSTKGMQTTFNLHRKRKKYSDDSPSKVATDNYTVVLSDKGKTRFKFGRKYIDDWVETFEKINFGKKCICDCHADTSKYFDFEKGQFSKEWCADFLESNKFRKLHSNFEKNKIQDTGKPRINMKHKNTTIDEFVANMTRDEEVQNNRLYIKSPYFAENENVGVQSHLPNNFHIPNYYNGIHFNPYYEPYVLPQYQYIMEPQYPYGMELQYQYGMNNNFVTHQNNVLPAHLYKNQFCDDFQRNASPHFPEGKNIMDSPEFDYNHLENEKDRYEKTPLTNDWTIGSFGKFKPVHLSTQKEKGRVPDKTDLVFSQSLERISKPDLEPSINLLSVSGERNCLESPGKLQPKLNSPEKRDAGTRRDETVEPNTQQRLEKELEAERSVLLKEFFNWDSQFTQAAKEDNRGGVGDEIGNDWMKKINNFGNSYYINKKTGFTTYYSPKPDREQFKMAERIEFIPKGMSPILKEVKQVDRSLSQSGKDKLLEYIMETYKNELLYIKWQHYLNDVDPNTFFENMYKEKLKMFEDCVPNISTKKKNLQDIVSFNKTLFQNIEVIGQVDKKFIAVLDKESNLLILFDQHAVHERIRLEKLLRIYRDAKSELVEKMLFFIPENDLKLLTNHESYLNFLGLSVEFFSNGINVVQVPLSLYSKFKDDKSSGTLNKMIHLLIKEIIELLKSTRGSSVSTLPELLQNIVNMEACRGSIKFGDSLTKEKCTELLKKLSTCDLPFQCAHGRPTLTPLLALDRNEKCVQVRVNFKVLLSENK